MVGIHPIHPKYNPFNVSVYDIINEGSFLIRKEVIGNIG